MCSIYQCYEIDVQENTSNHEKVLTPKQKVQKLMTDIGGGWYMKKIATGLPPLKRTKLSKKSQERQDGI